jgi:hypothetical protein
VERVPAYRSGGSGSIPSTTKKIVGLERGPLSFVSATEELLGRNSSGCGLKSREYGSRDSSRWPRGTFYPQKKVGIDFADKRRRSVDWGYGVIITIQRTLSTKNETFETGINKYSHVRKNHPHISYVTNISSLGALFNETKRLPWCLHTEGICTIRNEGLTEG